MKSADITKDAVDSGFWPLYRYNPENAEAGKHPLHLDSRAPKTDVADFMYAQNRFRILRQANPDRANALLDQIREDVSDRWRVYEELAKV